MKSPMSHIPHDSSSIVFSAPIIYYRIPIRKHVAKSPICEYLAFFLSQYYQCAVALLRHRHVWGSFFYTHSAVCMCLILLRTFFSILAAFFIIHGYSVIKLRRSPHARFIMYRIIPVRGYCLNPPRVDISMLLSSSVLRGNPPTSPGNPRILLPGAPRF